MSKKLKLSISIICLIAVFAMIPIAIFAMQASNFNIKNKISFVVNDVQGMFGYGISGSTSEGNVAYKMDNIFKTQWNEQSEDFDFITGENCSLEGGKYYIHNNNTTGNTQQIDIKMSDSSSIVLQFSFLNQAEVDASYQITFSINENSLGLLNEELNSNFGSDVFISTDWFYATGAIAEINLTEFSLSNQEFDDINLDENQTSSKDINKRTNNGGVGYSYGIYRLSIKINGTDTLNSSKRSELNDFLNKKEFSFDLQFDIASKI